MRGRIGPRPGSPGWRWRRHVFRRRPARPWRPTPTWSCSRTATGCTAKSKGCSSAAWNSRPAPWAPSTSSGTRSPRWCLRNFSRSRRRTGRAITAGSVRRRRRDWASSWRARRRPSRWPVVRIRPLKSSFWDRLDGAISLGASYTKSSAIGQGSLGVDVGARRPKFEFSTKFDTTITVQPDEPAQTRAMLTVCVHQAAARPLVRAGHVKFEQNTNLGLDLAVVPRRRARPLVRAVEPVTVQRRRRSDAEP